jgi:peptidyl-prolyl cis-trans isomerase C
VRSAFVLFLSIALVTQGCRKAASIEQAAAAAPALVAAQSTVKPVPKDLPVVLARVNGEQIERWELDSAIREIEALAVHPLVTAERDEIVRAVVDRLIGHHLAAQEARAKKLAASAAEIQASVDEATHEFSSQDEFTKMLQDFGLSLEQFRRQTQIKLEVSKFIRSQITPAVKIDQKAIAAYYEQNLTRFQQPETVRASHIFVSAPPGATPAQRQAARAKASAILDELRKGVDFADLAQSQSDDFASAASGGDIGTIARGQSDPAFEAATFALQAGQVSNVVETTLGFEVIKSIERHPATTASLDQVKGAIEQVLSEQAQNDNFSAFVERAKARSQIEILF